MNSSYFTRSHRLQNGVRVRLRLARPGDQEPVARLFGALGFDPRLAQLRDIVRFDPHERAVLCATALVGGSERVIGFGAMDLHAGDTAATVVAEPEHGGELVRLVRDGLRARAQLVAAA